MWVGAGLQMTSSSRLKKGEPMSPKWQGRITKAICILHSQHFEYRTLSSVHSVPRGAMLDICATSYFSVSVTGVDYQISLRTRLNPRVRPSHLGSVWRTILPQPTPARPRALGLPAHAAPGAPWSHRCLTHSPLYPAISCTATGPCSARHAQFSAVPTCPLLLTLNSAFWGALIMTHHSSTPKSLDDRCPKFIFHLSQCLK